MKKPKFDFGQRVYFIYYDTDKKPKAGRISEIRFVEWTTSKPLKDWFKGTSTIEYEITYNDDEEGRINTFETGDDFIAGKVETLKKRYKKRWQEDDYINGGVICEY